MPPPETPTGERTHFRDRTRSRPELAAPDTEIVVTDAVVAARPLEDAAEGLAFEVPLADLTELRCEGMLCRCMVLETDREVVEIPTDDLDEGALRNAIIERADLENTCTRLSMGNVGVCLCGMGTGVGCLLTVVGIGLILSVIGAVLGVAVAGVGLLILAGVYVSRVLSKYRGANVWERSGGPKSPV
jgi:hypothetical protein